MNEGEKIVYRGVEAIAVRHEGDSCDGCEFSENSGGCPSFPKDSEGSIDDIDCLRDKIIFKKFNSLGRRTKFIDDTYISVYDNSGSCDRCDIADFDDPLMCDQIDVESGLSCTEYPIVFIKVK